MRRIAGLCAAGILCSSIQLAQGLDSTGSVDGAGASSLETPRDYVVASIGASNLVTFVIDSGILSVCVVCCASCEPCMLLVRMIANRCVMLCTYIGYRAIVMCEEIPYGHSFFFCTIHASPHTRASA